MYVSNGPPSYRPAMPNFSQKAPIFQFRFAPVTGTLGVTVTQPWPMPNWAGEA